MTQVADTEEGFPAELVTLRRRRREISVLKKPLW